LNIERREILFSDEDFKEGGLRTIDKDGKLETNLKPEAVDKLAELANLREFKLEYPKAN
jgi:hypothetical protein